MNLDHRHPSMGISLAPLAPYLITPTPSLEEALHLIHPCEKDSGPMESARIWY